MTASSLSLDLPASLADALAATITPTADDGAMIDQLIGDLRAVSCQPECVGCACYSWASLNE